MGSKEFADRLPVRASLKGFLDALQFDSKGLVTVVSQDVRSKDVLMVAHANRQAIRKSLETGYMHYYSRSRGKLWKKGEDSKHTQKLVSLTVDCDGDALLARVHQVKGACHLGFRSCFSYRVGTDGKITVKTRKVFEPGIAYA